ncbi:MAG: diacylglycerol kinase family lipid kinase [Candidatus Eremiobacteraeota bacterium]|nr:diacylglycerol kinase family lipid kinase [Candidatus Eremiobacteraeota bacterium]
MAYQRIHLIINPAAGKDEPILNPLNDIFTPRGVDWQVHLTRKAGDGTRLARQAVEAGAEVVACYGGDGTLMEVANALVGGQVPLGILPGGTGNAMAFELGIPRNLREAAALLCQSETTRAVDLAHCGHRYFLLRAYTGPRAEDVASREEKDRLGFLAYPLAAMRVLANLELVTYRVEVDGTVYEDEGYSCFVFNAGSLGGIARALPDISPSDGLLDVLIVNDQATHPGVLASFLLENKLHAHRRQGRHITVTVDPPQTVWLDGEASGETPLDVQVVPGAIRVVV